MRPLTDDATIALGATVQAIRKRHGWTLTQVSERSGLSPSTLSKIERDKLSPTYANLVRLARGLRVSTSELFGGNAGAAPVAARHSVMRLDDGDPVETAQYLHYYLHMRLPSRAMTPILVDIRARTLDEFGPLIVHPGEEFTYVLSGLIEIHAGSKPPVVLAPGESIYFDSNMPHAYLLASRMPGRVLTVCSDLDQAELAEALAGH